MRWSSTPILAWHHFYHLAAPAVGLLSDGLLHAAELVALVGGSSWFADLRRRDPLVPLAVWGFLPGAGAFQLFDGLAWNIAAALLLLAGALVTRRASRRVGG